MKKVYLSGPMRGLPDYNTAAFNMLAEAWTAHGYDVFNPATAGHDAPPEDHYKVYLPEDIRQVLACDIVAVLPGWFASKGAMLEVMLAKLLGKQIVEAESGRDLYPFRVSHIDFALMIDAEWLTPSPSEGASPLDALVEFSP